MKESRRIQRVEKELQHIVGTFLLTKLNEPLDGIVSVSRVEVSPDLRSARVFLMMMSEGKYQQLNLQAIDRHAGQIQSEIHRQLPMRYTPKLRFIVDKGMSNALLVEQRLREIKEQGSKNETTA